MAAALKKALSTQQVLSDKLKQLVTNGRNTKIEKRNLGFYETKIAELGAAWARFDACDTTFREIVAEAAENCDDSYVTDNMYAEIEMLYTEYMGELKDNLKLKQNAEDRPTEMINMNTTLRQHTHVQLPRIALPKFSGDYNEWRSFHDLFISLIHNNTELDEVQKLQYLKTCLTGEAERLLKHTPVTVEDYVPAWTKLKNRYENKRLLVNTQIRILVNQPKIINENERALRQLIETTEECEQQLKSLKVAVSTWDTIIIYLLMQKLPFTTVRLWEEELGDSQELPSLLQFKKFLNTRFRVLEAVSQSTSTMKSTPTITKTYHTATQEKCPACNASHYVAKCKKFLNMNVKERRNCIEKSGRCFNCFSSNHVANKCTSKYKCRQCNNTHHNLLHHQNINVAMTMNGPQGVQAQHKADNSPAVNQAENSHTSNFFCAEQQDVLLATALVSVYDRNGRCITLRCLIDPGSQSSFITENNCKKLGIQGKSSKVEVMGLNKSQTTLSNRQVQVQVYDNKTKTLRANVTMLVIKGITDMLPSHRTVNGNWEHLKNMDLADPMYYKPGSVDILLGATAYAEILQGGLVKGPKDAPVAIQTTLGWILLGNSPRIPNQQIQTFTITQCQNDEISHQLKRFWEIEELPSKKILKPQDQECENMFEETHTRLDNGQYQVKLPFVAGRGPELGLSREMAKRRYNVLQTKFKENTELETEYSKCLDEYLTLNQMEKVNVENSGEHYYIPHHAVFKESTTTKLRVVFDASAKTTNKMSLNEQMLIGPTLQPTLFATLMKWRKYKIAITADIEKMYRMILIHPDHRKYQRIIWRDPATKVETDYQLKTVTFGTSAAPYLAIKTLQQLSRDEGKNYPLAAQAAISDFYVDDLLSGADNIEIATELQNQCIEMLKKGHFNLRKWASNYPEMVENLPLAHRELKDSFQFDESNTIKTLGIRWYPGTDNFSFSVSDKVQNAVTKRTILSQIASLYDPLGWISPVIIVAKLLIQSLWISGNSWDTEVNKEVELQWQEFKTNLKILSNIRIPRWLGSSSQVANYQIHGFCDASIKAYAAAVYMRVQNSDGSITSKLIASKTKVAPIKPVTLPRLELCGAVILARLIESTITAMGLINCTIIAWTDSTIALQWIQNHPSKWKTFVANRVCEIQEKVAPSWWRHIPTEYNPADLASRGIPAENIIENKLWWNGPSWLVQNETEWPESIIPSTVPALEMKKSAVISLMIHHENIFSRFSSFTRLKRSIALIFRFYFNAINKEARKIGMLKQCEINAAENTIFKLIQQQAFTTEYNQLSNNEIIHQRSTLITLMPFIDQHQVMRLGGRLTNANIPYNRKHPVILPSDHYITNLIIDEIHMDTLHGGVNLVLNTSRHLFWIINGKRTIATRINKCVICIRHRKQLRTQVMGNLPSPRVNISQPFSHVGMDFAGPITLKMSKHRTSRTYKGYICVLVCMATKAIHLELVSDLTTSAFLAAFRRFTSRRGLCTDIYSDCGTNFKGANVTLDKELHKAIMEATPMISQHFSMQKIDWHFNPPGAPHFGGLWEAGVKAVKFHLRRIIGTAVYTYEEYATLLCQVEACLNSRPLTIMDNRTEDMMVLTPGHFLIGQPINAVPEPSILETVPHGQRWRHIQYMTQQFWNKWSKEYLNTLQQRTKWRTAQPNMKIGDIVLLREENTAPTFWPLGRIEEIYPGEDGFVRVVKIKTAQSSFTRPITKICPLVHNDSTQL